MDITKSNTFEILKVIEDSRFVYGWFSVSKVNGIPVIDGENDVVDIYELEKAASDFVINSRVGGESHVKKGVSQLSASIVFTKEIQDALGISLNTEGWFGGFHVHDDVVWEKVKKGELLSFSIGGTADREDMVLNSEG